MRYSGAMRRRLLLIALVAVACAKEEPKAPGAGHAAAAPAKDPAEEKRKADEAEALRAAKRAELGAKQAELAQKVAALEKAYKELAAAHEKEQGELPDPALLRPRLSRLIQDAGSEKGRLESMEREFAELKKVAESEITGDLKALRAERTAIEARYQEAQSGWRVALDEARASRVEESPVKVELDTVRAVKEKWFELTPLARRKTPGAQESKAVNDGLRAWIAEKPIRKEAVDNVLAQEVAPKGKTSANFDFVDLDFFLLLELREDVLDKLNIAVESKRLKGEEEKLRAIEAELDAISEKIARKMSEGGGDLEKFEDLATRLPGQRSKAADLQNALASMRETFSRLEEVREAHRAAEEAAVKQLEAAKKELAEANAALKALG